MEFFARKVSVVLKTPLKPTKQAKKPTNTNKKLQQKPQQNIKQKTPSLKAPSFNKQTQGIVP